MKEEPTPEELMKILTIPDSISPGFNELKRRIEIGNKIRGEIINRVIEVEMWVNQFIANYFMGKNKKRSREFHHLVLSKESPSLISKINVILFVLGANYKSIESEFLETSGKGGGKKGQSQKPLSKGKIERFVNLRNHAAHRYIMEYDGAFHFVYLTTKQTELQDPLIKIDEAMLKEFMDTFTHLMGLLPKLTQTVLLENNKAAK